MQALAAPRRWLVGVGWDCCSGFRLSTLAVDRVGVLRRGRPSRPESDWPFPTAPLAPHADRVPTIDVESQSSAGNPVVTTKPLYLSDPPIAISVSLQRATVEDQVLLQMEAIDVEAFAQRYDFSA